MPAHYIDKPDHVEVDRGFDEPCWIIPHMVTYNRPALRWLAKQIGARPPKHVYMHLCEIFGERNFCINPTHVKIATYSENIKHAKDLKRLAGHRHGGNPTPKTPEWRANISRGLRRYHDSRCDA